MVLIRKVADDAAKEANKVLEVFSNKKGLARYTDFVQQERDIVLSSEDDMVVLEKGLEELFNEFSITLEFAHNTLLKIHLEENPHDAVVVLKSAYGYADLVFLYGLGRELFPEKTEEEAVNIFRMLCRAGRTNLLRY